MSDMQTSVTVDLAGNLTRRARQYGQALDGFSKRGARSLSVVKRSAHLAGKSLDKMANRWTGMATGAAGAASIKMLLGLDDRLTRLGIQANKSTSDMDRLKKSIFETAQLPHIRVDPGQIIGAIEEIVEKTGDLDFAKNNLENLGLAIQATGAQGSAIGSITAEFQKMGIISKNDVREALDILTVQGKSGAFTLQNLAAMGSRTVTAYTAMGRTGIPAIREMGAALQVIREGTGSSEQATTAFEALLRTLGNAQKLKKLQAGGIQVFDPEALKKGHEILRPINELMVEIVERTGGKKTLLSQVFDEEAMKAFNSAASEFKQTGSVERLDKFMNIHSNGSAILGDSTRAAKTATNELKNLFTAWQKFADSNLTGPIRDVAAILNTLSGDTAQKAIGVAAYGGSALIGASLAKKAYSGTKNLFGLSDKAGGVGKLLSGVSKAAPMPVIVMNPGMKGIGSDNSKSSSAKGRRSSLMNGPAATKGQGSMRGVRNGGKFGRLASYGKGALGGAATLALANPVATTALVGAGVGTMAGNALKETSIHDSIYYGFQSLLATFGNDSAKRELAMQKLLEDRVELTPPRASVEVKVTADGVNTKVQNLRADNMDLDVDNGLQMSGY